MKLFVKLLALVLVAALAGPFFINGPDGRPLMSVSESLPDWQRISAAAQHQWSRLAGKAKSLAGRDGGASADGRTRLYKWRDANGNWQYSDEPPASGAAETIFVDPNVNLIPGTPPPAPRPELAPAREKAPLPEPAVVPPIMDPGRVKQLVDDAKDVQRVLDERARRIDDASDGYQ